MKELRRLKKLLKGNNIPYTNKTIIKRNDGINISYDNYNISVVCHKYSYGGKQGLLEMMAEFIENDVIGWLTAKEVLKILEEKR